MRLSDIIKTLNLELLTEDYRDVELNGAYVSDLLSDVMANAKIGEVWITLQTHINIVAVATLKKIPAIIITTNRRPDSETINRSQKEGIALFQTELSTFETAGRLYNLLREEKK